MEHRYDAENMCGKEWVKSHKNSTNFEFALYRASLSALGRLEWFQKAFIASTQGSSIPAATDKTSQPAKKTRSAGQEDD
ncbi:hypothetical protein NP233_g4686 [Leucocoprinus birnbaumii]|uniref:Uncharacterized protein n=1 Tax=Leucocoprinus birnbaumii TaxID=56174 RepID=A0AAD5VUC6_9AGAR|nr:hypothetical protein NP233_g4686 [Leucocoprinus birnbaumii]